ncbi:MAG TPA: class I SAM-dependent methyltransferase [Gemmataceae bacterium]|nr:class I SAM-dependent methyltransferase [Gemmataceae bacterium]
MKLPVLLKKTIHRIGRAYVQRIVRGEAEEQPKRFNERAIEYRFVFQSASRLCPQKVLDVGTGQSALPALLRICGIVVTASDNVTDYWPEGMYNRHWHVVDDDITKSNLPGGYDMVTCISVLEHIRDHRAAVQEMFRLLSPGGHLLLTCPYTENEYVDNVYDLLDVRLEYRNLPYGCRSYSRRELEEWLSLTGGSIAEQEFWRIETSRVHGLGEWLYPAVQVSREESHQLTCLLLHKPKK